jgi:hypothetical protein
MSSTKIMDTGSAGAFLPLTEVPSFIYYCTPGTMHTALLSHWIRSGLLNNLATP